jgi:replicative DNA helicase
LYTALLSTPAPDPLRAGKRAVGAWPLSAQAEERSEWLDAVLVKANAGVRGLTSFHLHALVAACPRPAHAAVYGRMVLEGALRRAITDHADHLRDALTGPEPEPEKAVHRIRALNSTLGDLARRWGAQLRPTASPVPLPVQDVREPPSSQLLDDERYLISALTTHPHALGELVSWLRPEDFSAHAHARIYQCLTTLRHRGEPVDAVTVLWEAQRRGALADGTFTGPDDVLHLCDAPAADGMAGHLGERIVRAAFIRTGLEAVHQLRVLADDASHAPDRLISHSLLALRPVQAVHQRWQAAHGTPSLPAAPAAVAARAAAARARSPSPPPTPPTASAPPSPLSSARAPRRSFT